MNFTISRLILRYSVSARNSQKFTRKYFYASNKFNCVLDDRRFLCTVSSKDDSAAPDSLLMNEFDFAETSYLNVDLDAVTEGDPDKLKALKLLQLEIEMLKQQGEKVPKHISVERWKELLILKSSKQHRIKFLNYLWVNEIKKTHLKEKKQNATKLWMEKKVEMAKNRTPVVTTSSPVTYGLNNTTLFHRIYDQQIKNYYNYKLLQAMMLGPHILVDCGYEPFMGVKDTGLCAKQLLLMWSENRDCFNPFNLIFCNMEPNGTLLRKLRKVFPTLDEPDFPFNVTSANYLDLYPREKLVYLTPHCNQELDHFNSDDIYIIGAFVDKSKSEPLSLAKGKKDNLRMAKFPLDRYLHWGYGIKSLTLNQCISILNDVKDGHTWTYAFRHIPKRKLASQKLEDEYECEKTDNRVTAKSIREQFRRNLVYDMLIQEK